MFIVKNLKENVAGNLECEILNGDVWTDFIMSPNDEYEIHEDSKWQDVKPLDPAEKSAYEATQARNAIIAELAALDAPSYKIERAIAGEPEAIAFLAQIADKKDVLRAKMGTSEA